MLQDRTVTEHPIAVPSAVSLPLDALRSQAAVLDRAGRVRAVSPGWAQAANAGALFTLPRSLPGTDYLATCAAAAANGIPEASAACNALRAVLDGHSASEVVTYACGSPALPLWYELRVSALCGEDGLTGAILHHIDITERKQAELWQGWIARVVSEIKSGFCVTDSSGIVLYADPSWCAMHGYDAAEVTGQHTRIFHTPEQFAEAVLPFVRTAQERGQHRGELGHCRKDGTTFITEAFMALVRDDQHTPVGLLIVARDISDLKQAEMAMRHGEERFRALVQNGSDIIVVLDSEGRVHYVSPSVERVLGYRPEAYAAIRLTVGTMIHPEDAERIARVFSEVARTPGAHPTVEFRARHADGSWRHLEAVATNLMDVPSVGGIVINARDITERKSLEAELRRQAFHDALTDLPNRALFLDRLSHALDRLRRTHSGLAVLFIDLDGFKVVNDSLGHGAGDALLKAIAARLSTCLRPADTVARFGGDEFAVLIEDAGTASQVLKIAARLIDAVSRPLHVSGRDVVVAASIGITLCDSFARSAESLLREADIALYEAKNLGKARAVLFDDGMDRGVRERLELETDLRRALERQELLLYYQPEVDLATGTIVGVEALVRWQHPTRGLVPPNAFIPLAEETGLIVPIGEWVLREACRQAVAWQALGGPLANLVMSVNISARQFAQRNLAEQVGEALGYSGLAPECLRLEITESAVMADLDLAIANLAACKDLGVQLALDDFGTGYSSLNYLLRFPVDVLKIDRSFVQRLAEDRGAAAIVRAVTATAHALNLDVTGEGIETPQHLCHLRELQCQRGQGYFFSRPMPAAGLLTLIASGNIPIGDKR